jgi:hypothetical protein
MRQAANPGGSALRERLGRWFRVDPRPVPAARPLRTALRTAHLIAAGALYGGHVYGVEAERLVPALAGVLVTGGAFLAIEVYQASVWLVQIRGVATLVKLALVGAVAVFWELRVLLLTLAVIVGGVSSHMPGRWRYHSVIHGRVVGPQESG